MVVSPPAAAGDIRPEASRPVRRRGPLEPGSRAARDAAAAPAATALAVLALAALLTATAACADGTPGMRAAVVDAQRSDGLHGRSPATPVRKPALDLTGTDGLPFDLPARTAGLVTLLYFGYTHCPDVCPATMADLAQAMGELDPAVRAQIRVVFVSTDPARDTPVVLAAWLHRFDPGFGFYGLAGPFDQVLAQARALGVEVAQPPAAAGGPVVQHQDADVLAFGHDGLLALRYPPGTQITDYLHDLPILAARGTTQ